MYKYHLVKIYELNFPSSVVALQWNDAHIDAIQFDKFFLDVKAQHRKIKYFKNGWKPTK